MRQSYTPRDEDAESTLLETGSTDRVRADQSIPKAHRQQSASAQQYPAAQQVQQGEDRPHASKSRHGAQRGPTPFRDSYAQDPFNSREVQHHPVKLFSRHCALASPSHVGNSRGRVQPKIKPVEEYSEAYSEDQLTHSEDNIAANNNDHDEVPYAVDDFGLTATEDFESYAERPSAHPYDGETSVQHTGKHGETHDRLESEQNTLQNVTYPCLQGKV